MRETTCLYFTEYQFRAMRGSKFRIFAKFSNNFRRFFDFSDTQNPWGFAWNPFTLLLDTENQNIRKMERWKEMIKRNENTVDGKIFRRIGFELVDYILPRKVMSDSENFRIDWGQSTRIRFVRVGYNVSF